MMPIDFEGSNALLARPENMTAEECGDLRARLAETYRGPQYTTCWKPSYEDIKDIDAGKGIAIEMYIGETVFVNVSTRFQEYPPLCAHHCALVWIPGAVELADIKSGTGIYITLLTTSFPVMSVYVNE